MHEVAERLAQSMLYEGYALYPYTPEATKNSTPTPFGIAYPTAYAERQPAAFDHVQVEVIAEAGDDAEVEAAAVFLQASGPRHQASERREGLDAIPLSKLLGEPLERTFVHEPGPQEGAVTGESTANVAMVLSGTVRLSAERVGEGLARLRMRVENTTPLPEEEADAMERGGALQRSLLSCHAMLGIGGEGAKFISPLENEGEPGVAVQACVNVNTWPVLASPDDDAVLGAAYMLPDHPQVAPESHGNMFDNTEIEEALMLHVRVLSDEERAAIGTGDPAVREMVERAEAATSEDMLALHGVMKPTDAAITLVPPDPSLAEGIEFPEWTEPGTDPEPAPQPDAPRQAPPPGPADTAGEEEIVVDGRSFVRGAKVVLRPGIDGDPYDKMMDGRMATIERIYLDYDGRAYLGVSVDDDPMSEVLRETGRYLFFFADEVEHP